MPPKKQTLFISDLHLQEGCPNITQKFIAFLQQTKTAPPNAIYVLGDFFEYWIGDDDITEFHRYIMNALKDITQTGLPIYFLHGNRDFLLGNRFFSETGCQWLPDQKTVSIYGNPVLLMHGDTLCTKDKNYIRARKVLRNQIVQKIFLLAPLKTRRNFAAKLRTKSQQHVSVTDRKLMDVADTEVVRVMKMNQASYLIHGHTHLPGIHQFEHEHSKKTRIVLGAWHEKGSVLIWDEAGEKKLIDI